MSGPQDFGGMFQLDGLMKMARDLQQKLQSAQSEASALTATAAAGGGLVRATVDGRHRLVALHVEPEVFSAEGPEMLQDLTIAAVNMAMEKVDALLKEKMSDATGGMPLPFDLPDLGR